MIGLQSVRTDLRARAMLTCQLLLHKPRGDRSPVPPRSPVLSPAAHIARLEELAKPSCRLRGQCREAGTSQQKRPFHLMSYTATI